MAFVNEIISAEDKEKIDFSNIAPPPSHDTNYPLNPRRWIVDREKNAFLIWTGNGRQEKSNQHWFIFWWKGNPIHLSMTKTFVEKNTLQWRDIFLDCPHHLNNQYTEIIEVLREALAVYGNGTAPDLHVALDEVQFGNLIGGKADSVKNV